MQRFKQRQAFLVSATVHLLILAIFSSREASRSSHPVPLPDTLATLRSRVFLPPPEVLRQLAQVPIPKPRPAKPTPPIPESRRDRLSVGPPSAERTERLVLRKEDDLTAVSRGIPRVDPEASMPQRAPTRAEPPAAQPSRLSGPALGLPPDLDTLSPEEEGSTVRRDGSQPLIGPALRDLERRLSPTGALGNVAGEGRHMGPLFFDPEGADFTLWINHFKNEVYRNWIVPQAALLGFKGNVDLEFVVARDGTLSNLTLVSSSGTAALDRSARNALLGSRFLELPRDYTPNEITMRVRFIYG